jgi:hypothetical protein
MKKCKYCLKQKQLSEFPKHSGHRDGHAAICKQCKKKKYPTTAEQKQRAYERNIKRNYGITVDDYNAMYESQGGLCLGCKRGNNGSRFHIDHCHTTGEVRGLLCSKCNAALGLLEDNIETLSNLIVYLSYGSTPKGE